MPQDEIVQAADVEEEQTQVQDNLGDDEVKFKYSITSYGADYPVDGLVKRIQAGDIFIPPFQRQFVWDQKRGSRFVESLLLGLPVPGIFLSKEDRTQKLLVIDGQQRLRTLQYFYGGIFADSRREFALSGVQQQFEGKTYKTLLDEDRRRLDDSILHATIVKQEEPSADESSIYHIFERLNTGGVILQPQEIRACIYHGEFQEELKRLNQNDDWRGVYGPVSARMKDQELILRFLALFLGVDKYSKPMKGFLNTFMGNNRHLRVHPAGQLQAAFNPTIQLAAKYIGMRPFRPRAGFNAAVFDSVMVGLARRLQKGEIQRPDNLEPRYVELIANPEFTAATETGTSSEDKVATRLSLATVAFTDVR